MSTIDSNLITTNLQAMTNAISLTETQQMLAATNFGAVSNATIVTTTNSVCPGYVFHFCPSVSVVGLMLLGVALGSIGSVCYEMAKASVSTDEDPKTPPKQSSFRATLRDLLAGLPITMGMGIAAVALVPAFLRTVSSNLIKDAQESFESKLVLFAFCVAATLIAKKLIGTFPEKLFNLAKDANKKSVENQETLTKFLEAFVNRTGRSEAQGAANAQVAHGVAIPAAAAAAPVPPVATPDAAVPAPVAAPVAQQLNPLPAYNYPEFLVILAFLNPRYLDGRTTVGLAMDTGLTMGQVAAALSRLTVDGHVRQTEQLSRDLNLWQITDRCRAIFSGRITRDHIGGLSVVEVGIQ